MITIKNITVFNENDEEFGSTYERRAKQLVKKERAVWMDDKTIRLVGSEPENPSSDEVLIMDAIGNGTNYEVVKETEKDEIMKLYDENELLKFAEDNLKHKRGVIIHSVIFGTALSAIAVIFTTFFEDVSYYSLDGYTWRSFLPSQVIVLAFVVLVLWCVGYAAHLVAYFTRKTPDKLLKEYNRLKKDIYNS